MTKIVSAVAFAASLTGIASSDDSSISRIGGDSYAYFNSLPIDKSPSAWRQSNPSGEPEYWYQSNSSWGTAWKPAPVLTNVASDPTFRQTHPNGLTERELQAMSSEGPAWHTDASNTTPAASSDNKETLADRAAAFFRIAK
ncbi:MAG TPA: hypothetical protein VGK75_19455 [Casimicrobiaceae bacterium]|jgi:hypothetical protein